MRLTLCYLYPDLMNTYGDRGNVITLTRRAFWRGIELQVVPVSVGETPDLRLFDIIFFGGGQDKEQKIVSEDLVTTKRDSLVSAVEDGVVVLAVCGGYQLLGEYYRPRGREELLGAGVLAIRTEAGEDRFIGNVVVEPNIPIGGRATIVGFENHSGRTYLGSGVHPLGRVIVGRGNNGQDGFEGCVYKNVFGTYLHGPLLPKNPHLADYLIWKALIRRYGDIEPDPLDDTLEWRAHEAAIARAKHDRAARSALSSAAR